MLSLRGLRNLLACLVGKTPLVFVVELYDSYVSSGESAYSLSPGLSDGHDPWSQPMHVIQGT